MPQLSGRKSVEFLRGNLIESEEGNYLAYFDEFPELIVQGDSSDEAKELLLEGLLAILEERRKATETAISFPGYSPGKISHFHLLADL